MENNKKTKNNDEKTLKRTATVHRTYEFHINDRHSNIPLKIQNNTIKTTKYNILTFLPKSLLFQFMRLANVYFLFIAIIQSIRLLSPLSPATAIIPIAFVLTVSIIREGIEDYARYKYDKALNSEPCLVYRDS